jgi:hypothetical protein
MRLIIITLIFVLTTNVLFGQTTYNMKIKQGSGTTYSLTSTVDQISFDNSTNFTCGNTILYGGETYPTVLIGSQCWFQKNLNIGTRINGSTDQTDNSTIEKYCYSDLESNCTTYGGLYQWAETVQYQNGATNTSSPSAFSGNVQGTGGGAGTNTSGFSALMGGLRYSDPSFIHLGDGTPLWSTTESDVGKAYDLVLLSSDNSIPVDINQKEYGFSVRCLKD